MKFSGIEVKQILKNDREAMIGSCERVLEDREDEVDRTGEDDPAAGWLEAYILDLEGGWCNEELLRAIEQNLHSARGCTHPWTIIKPDTSRCFVGWPGDFSNRSGWRGIWSANRDSLGGTSHIQKKRRCVELWHGQAALAVISQPRLFSLAASAHRHRRDYLSVGLVDNNSCLTSHRSHRQPIYLQS